MSALTSAAYCPDCDEGSRSPIGSSCETCGATLVKRAAARGGSAGAPGRQQEQQVQQMQRALLDALPIILSAQGGGGGGGDGVSLPPGASALLRSSLQSLAQQSASVPPDAELWETPPPEAMMPFAAVAAGRPTATNILDRIPRIVVDERSAVLHTSTVALAPGGPLHESGVRLAFDAVVGEFGRTPPYELAAAEMVVAEPIHGCGASAPEDKRYAGKIVVFERGGGITFAMKAVEAARRGAVGVIVLQNVAVWP